LDQARVTSAPRSNGIKAAKALTTQSTIPLELSLTGRIEW
jgi:hypothetical protein